MTIHEDRGMMADLERALGTALEAEGLELVHNFRVPGEIGRQVELYIPNLPRSIIEIKALRSPDPSVLNAAVDQLLDYGTLVESEFGGTLMLFLVLFGEFDRTMREQIEGRLAQLPGAEVVYGGPLSESVETLAARAAVQIRTLRAEQLPTIYLQLDEINTSEKIRQRPVPPGELDNLVEFIKTHGFTEPLLVYQQTDDSYVLVDGHRRIAALQRLREESTTPGSEELFNKIPAKLLSKLLNGAWDKDTPIRDRLTPVLKSIIQLVEKKERKDVIQDEFNELCQEHETDHYTSCALRVGRLLEYLVYCLATDWGIPVNHQMLHVMAELDKETDKLKVAFFRYYECLATLSEKANERKKTSLVEKIETIQKRLNEVLGKIALPKSETVIESTAPRNVRVILTDIKNKYIRIELVRKTIDSINEKGGLVQRIFDFRNEAAHADTKLEKREVDPSKVESMIEDLREIVNLLTNVGEAVRNSRSL